MANADRPNIVVAKASSAPWALHADRRTERVAFIARSHQRSADLGLTRIERPDFAPLNGADLNVARERSRELCAHAAPIMELLFEQIVETHSMIVLTDAQGFILDAIGDQDFLARVHKVALQPGVSWAEQSKGTNAIGTALIEEVPTLVHGSEHFMHANSFLTCSAVPIFDPCGNMLGVLDVTGDQRSYQSHTMGLVRMSARMIENRWLANHCADRLRLHFHSRVESLGTLLEAIIVAGSDGRIVGANCSALDQLGMGIAALRQQTLASLFGTSVAAVFDHFRASSAQPMCLRLSDGRQFHASAQLNGGPRPTASGFEAATARPGRARFAPGDDTALQVAAADAAAPPRVSALAYLRTGDAQIDAVVLKVQRAFNGDIPVLIQGETGTGKELLARAVRHDSNRARQPFVAVNCASIPEHVLEAELFGEEEGPAGLRRSGAIGRIVQAQGGTLFLDEIDDMPLALQARLLRLLRERSRGVPGSGEPGDVDMAVIAATQCDLRELIAAGSFREDLYYRLNGLLVKLPALRERTDLRAIAYRVLHTECAQPPKLGSTVMELFERYLWPGNIRQLANVLRAAVVMAAGEPVITEQHLSDDFLEDARHACRPAPAIDEPGPAPRDVRPAAAAMASPPTPALAERRNEGVPSRTLDEAEVELIQQTLAAVGGNISKASRRLGISRNTIYRKLRWTRPG